MKNLKKKRKIITIFLVITSLFILLSIIFLIYFFTLNRELDLSLIKTGASSVTKIHYFDYENREYRIGKDKELKEEELFLQKSEWCSIYEMPEDLLNAFIAIEDKRFYKHDGIDFVANEFFSTTSISGKVAPSKRLGK